MSFRVLGVSIAGNKFDLSYPIKSDENYITVMTGKNGSGKSRILEFVSRSFVNSDDLLRYHPERWAEGVLYNRPRAISYKTDSVCYTSSGFDVFADSMHREVSMSFETKSPVDNRYDVFPAKVICLSTSPFDRFPSTKRRTKWMTSDRDADVNDSIYTYIGLKSSSSVSVKGMIANVIDTILRSPEKINSNVGVIRDTLSYLGYGKRIRLTFKSAISNGLLLHDDLDDVMLNIKMLNDSSNYDLRKLSEAIKTLRSRHTNSKEQFSVSMNLVAEEMVNDDYISSIRLLLSNGIIKILGLKLSLDKDNRRFITFSHASSGEQCLALMMLGIASVIESNSLICIDEPEISLHPEWQEEFIPMIKKSFSAYTGCHFIIATHSPLIISNLVDEHCSVLDLDQNELLELSRKGYSSDYQLATLFKSPGFKNEYLVNESLDILNLFSKSKMIDDETIQRAQNLVELIGKLDFDDPVYSLISTIEKVLEVVVND